MKHIYSGKVRDIYEVDEDRLLFVTSDRMSAFDVVMAQPIPGKGRALTAITAFWVAELAKVAPSHLLEVGLPAGVDLRAAGIAPAYAEGRTMLVRRARMLPSSVSSGVTSRARPGRSTRVGHHARLAPAGRLAPVPTAA